MTQQNNPNKPLTAEQQECVRYLEDSPKTICVYLGENAKTNFEAVYQDEGEGAWGWKKRHRELHEYQIGDLIVFACGNGGRLGKGALEGKEAEFFVVGKLTTDVLERNSAYENLFPANEPLFSMDNSMFPFDDESFIYRVGIKWLARCEKLPYNSLPEHVREQLRVSGTQNSRGLIAENSLQENLERVLKIQEQYNQIPKDPTMKERTDLLEKTIPSQLDRFLGRGAGLTVRGTHGTGNQARVPYLRVFDPEKSKTAQEGIYLVYIFSEDGDFVYLSLMQAATKGERRNDLPEEDLKKNRDRARDILQPLTKSLENLEDDIYLGKEGLAKSYAKAHITGWRYKKGDIPTDEQLRSDFDQALKLLQRLYLPEPDDGSVEKLAKELFLDPGDQLKEIIELLDDRPQAIFYGPPGTGKTFVAKKLANLLASGPDKVEFVQFHSSYAYEDFVAGWRPKADGSFTLKSGVLKRFAERAANDLGNRYVLVIDEINRANLSKVFGELFYLLEYRNEKVTLQYSTDEDDEAQAFALPANLFILGTMNTADRSIALVDAALRRRFYFHPFFPSDPPIKGTLRCFLNNNHPNLSYVADIVDQVNEDLNDRNLAIGHSYFMKERLTEERVEQIWKFSVLPYIEDIFCDSHEQIAKYAFHEQKQIYEEGEAAERPLPEVEETPQS